MAATAVMLQRFWMKPTTPNNKLWFSHRDWLREKLKGNRRPGMEKAFYCQGRSTPARYYTGFYQRTKFQPVLQNCQPPEILKNKMEPGNVFSCRRNDETPQHGD
jgi:hypothetical protein